MKQGSYLQFCFWLVLASQTRLLIIPRWIQSISLQAHTTVRGKRPSSQSTRDSMKRTCPYHGTWASGIQLVTPNHLWYYNPNSYHSHKTIKKASPNSCYAKPQRSLNSGLWKHLAYFEPNRFLEGSMEKRECIIYWTHILQESKRAGWCLKWNNESIKIHSFLLQVRISEDCSLIL